MGAVRWIQDLAEEPVERLGGKAMSLGRMSRAGFNVPDAFVIPTDVAHQLGETWPEELFEEILGGYRRLASDGSGVAVRSSASDEDSEAASFAGQHATILNVSSEDGLIAAVRECLASLHSEAASAYRGRTGTSDRPARMAIVVQRMIPAEVAGVAFSVDPLTGDTNRIVVEAVRGLGEGLVSGTVEGDRMVLDRDTLAVVEAHHPGEPALEEALAREAARAALRAEEEYGTPQDIEFAWATGVLWMLQSRPVTTLTRQEAAEGWVSEFDSPTSAEDHWTSANVQEILPGLLTPLTITVLTETAPESYTRDYQELGLLDRDENPRFVGVFYNRVFLNISATRLVGDRALGGSGDAVERRYLGGEIAATAKTRHGLKTWKHRIVSAPRMVWMLLTLEKRAEKADRAVAAHERRVTAMDFAAMSDEALGALRERLMLIAARRGRVHLRVTAMAGFGFENVQKVVAPILGEETEARLPTLFTGLPNVESAQIGIDLWGLSRVAKREGMESRLRAPGFDPNAADLPATWRERYGAFTRRHGHRGLNELEAAAKTWRADPTALICTLVAYLDMDEAHSPVATFERQREDRLQLEKEVAAAMNPLRRAIYRYLLRDAQKWVALRERTKSMVVREARCGDLLLPEIQRRMIAAKAIDTADDLFFLANGEISAWLRGEKQGFQQAVARRRKEYERNRHVLLPERFRGRPAPIEPDLSHHAGDVLTGTPVSPGVVTGRARVIFDPATDGPMLPGEILVAPVTDAGWTPLFALAAGLVVDMGSALSHGSTVAREYGLPAVVNVRRGTLSIRTGDLITVNGSKGTVVVLEA